MTHNQSDATLKMSIRAMFDRKSDDEIRLARATLADILLKREQHRHSINLPRKIGSKSA